MSAAALGCKTDNLLHPLLQIGRHLNKTLSSVGSTLLLNLLVKLVMHREENHCLYLYPLMSSPGFEAGGKEQQRAAIWSPSFSY